VLAIVAGTRAPVSGARWAGYRAPVMAEPLFRGRAVARSVMCRANRMTAKETVMSA
jgi:hypothetical protein